MILRNAAICTQCDETIISRHVHDYVVCGCGGAVVDGGREYLKRGGTYTDISVTTWDAFKDIREGFEWGTYGKDGKSELRYVKLKELDEDHVRNILELKLSDEVREIFNKELKWRSNAKV